MRIIHVVGTLQVGGAEVLVTQLCRLHRGAGHEVAVYCLLDRGPLATKLEEEGFEVHLQGPLPTWKLMRKLYEAFRRSLPHVVHCHNANATRLTAPAARLAGVPCIISTRHGCYPPPRPMKQELIFWLAARFCDRVVAVCSAAYTDLASTFGVVREKLVTLYNGVAPAPLDVSRGEEIRKDGFTLIHVARLAWYKDQPNLLRAVALAKDRVPDICLWMVGDGKDAPALKALARQLGIERHVRFCGEQRNVGRWLEDADLFVLPSLKEGVPLSLLEAMAAGLPAIVTDVGGMPEVARLSGAATIVPPGNSDALAQAIIDQAERREELAGLGERARLCYQKYFTLDRMGEEYLKLYAECLRSRVPGYLQPVSEPFPAESCPASSVQETVKLQERL